MTSEEMKKDSERKDLKLVLEEWMPVFHRGKKEHVF